MAEDVVNVHATYGALLLGGLVASMLNGLVVFQVIAYFKTYEGDHKKTKALVALIFVLDCFHTALLWASLWDYIVKNINDITHIHKIYWAISATVTVTGILTFVIHSFFSYRIFMLSQHNWFLSVPIMFLVLLRLVSATVTTAKMTLYDTFHGFQMHFGWVFTLGLGLSTAVDILITGSLFFLLKTSRTENFNLNAVINTLILYAFEMGALTTIGTTTSLIFWLVQKNNLIFMGLHFIIAKLYANSMLVTLNTRKNLNLHRMKPTMDFRPGGHGQRGDDFTLSLKDPSAELCYKEEISVECA